MLITYASLLFKLNMMYISLLFFLFFIILFKEGVRTVTQGGDNASVIVSITNKGNKGNWLLPVFEGGTDERYRTYRRRAQGIEFKSKESGRTGKIGAIHFFSKAVDSLKGGIGEKFTKEIIRRLKNII